MTTRRSFLFMSAAIITTPGVLMPVRKIITPPPLKIVEFEIGRYEGFRFIESPLFSHNPDALRYAINTMKKQGARL